jgi:tetratricopeptide (TPR) repeat protein
MSSQGSITQAPSSQASWPVLSGHVPPLADSFVPRQETGLGAAAALVPGETTVLVPPSTGAGRSLAGLGGTGKTQLATAIAHALWEQGTVELVVWLAAAGRDAVVSGFAQALGDAGLPDPGEGADLAAAQFVAWLARTSQPWLVVLDDLTDPVVMDGLWPRGRSGRVLVTTSRPETAARAPSPRVVEIGMFSAREAMAYLSGKLHSDPDQWIGALDLASDLGFLPFAVGQAAALMADAGLDCRQYRAMVSTRRERMAGSAGSGFLSVVTAAWSIAAEYASQLAPAGLAGPALALVSLLDPAGVPGVVFTSPAARAYLARSWGVPEVDEAQVRAALYNLARAGLVTIDTTSAARTVTAHTLVGATARENLAEADTDAAARAAAQALFQAWPQSSPAPFEQALRDSTVTLHELAGRPLWESECHPLLLRAGISLDSSGQSTAAVGYWQRMGDISHRMLGAGHASTVLLRDRLAAALEAAGHPADAITIYERTLADRESMLGVAHPGTLATRSSLARAYRAVGRAADAVRLAERTFTECGNTRGPRHPDTLTAQAELGEAYLAGGRLEDAISAFAAALAAREAALGQDHLDTLTSRGNLAYAFRLAGRHKQALPLFERALGDRERVQGPDHPDTITARGNLAAAYRAAGRMKDAILACKRALADRERVQGPDHPDTITARGNLADTYQLANKLKEAVPLYERALADRERVQGPDHPDTITARGNLAYAYHSHRKLAQAIPLYERTLADFERVQGPGHQNTLTSRANLGHAYHTAGRQTEALAVFRQTLADCEQALGPGHPLTQAARETLATVSGT